MKQERPLDLTRESCHACSGPLIREIKNKKEYCINHGCQIRNVRFTIPFVKEEGDDSKS